MTTRIGLYCLLAGAAAVTAATVALASPPAAPPAAPAIGPTQDDDDLFGAAATRAMPAVVRITGVSAGTRVSPFGTGVLVSPKGHILTIYSAMLAEDADRELFPKVTLSDGRVVKARVWLKSRDLEAAVLKIVDADVRDLPHLKPDDSDGVRAGDWLMILGNAFNLAAGEETPSVNLGVLSAVVDQLDASVRIGAGEYRYKGRAFLTDANNNPGSYGGPMITADGRWVGLTGRIVAGKATNTQLNYGVPINELKPLLEEALRREKPSPDEDFARPVAAVKRVTPGYHGIHLFEEGGQLPPPYVDRLDRASPAKKAGLRGDDLVQYINGKLVQTCAQFYEAMAALPPGAEVKMTVLRGRSDPMPVELSFQLGEPKALPENKK